jgi:quercetin dioxygenase-like cupin family protein
MFGMMDLDQSRVFKASEMPVRKMANGGESRDVVKGTLLTGEVVALHGSMQPAGMVPNPAHAIEHTEVLLVQQGTIEITLSGMSQTVTPGDVVLIAKGTLHQVKNVGDGPAKYMIVAIGGDIKARV